MDQNTAHNNVVPLKEVSTQSASRIGLAPEANLAAIPQLTHLSIFVLTLLCEGEKYAREIRQSLIDHQYKHSVPAFYQLMGRLLNGEFVTVRKVISKNESNDVIKESVYSISAKGRAEYLSILEFYRGLIEKSLS